jgi:hypothetical protein
VDECLTPSGPNRGMYKTHSEISIQPELVVRRSTPGRNLGGAHHKPHKLGVIEVSRCHKKRDCSSHQTTS